MRKSVAIGFGLWLLAVASVAVIAWLAINTAGHQVTAVTVVGPGPTPSLSISRAPAGQTSPQAVPVAAKPARDSASPASTTPPDTGAVRAYFGTFSTDGGRIRAKCAQQAVSLDGGYARPETGWEVKMLPAQPERLVVFFGSKDQAIEVLAVCAGGRPAFTQQSQVLQDGKPSIPAQQPQDGRFAPVQPSSNALLAPEPTDTAGRDLPTRSPLPLAPSAPAVSADPSPPAVDPAQVAAYVQMQNMMCAQGNWSSDWCHRWAALSDDERIRLVQRWLASAGDGGRGDGYGDGRSDLTGRDGDRSSRDGVRYPAWAGHSSLTSSPAASSDDPEPSTSGIPAASGR